MKDFREAITGVCADVGFRRELAQGLEERRDQEHVPQAIVLAHEEDAPCALERGRGSIARRQDPRGERQQGALRVTFEATAQRIAMRLGGTWAGEGQGKDEPEHCNGFLVGEVALAETGDQEGRQDAPEHGGTGSPADGPEQSAPESEPGERARETGAREDVHEIIVGVTGGEVVAGNAKDLELLLERAEPGPEEGVGCKDPPGGLPETHAWHLPKVGNRAEALAHAWQ